MARPSKFPRLGDHHLGVEILFRPRDETESAHFQAIGTAKDVDVLGSTLHFLLYQMKRSAHEVLIRNGVPQTLLADVAATHAHVREHFGSDTEPGFAANLLVMTDGLEMRDAPLFVAGALSMFAALKTFYEMGREFKDGPALAREAAGARARSSGGDNKRTNAAAWIKSRNRRIRKAFQAARSADPGLSENDWAADRSCKWTKTEDGEVNLRPRSIREILSRARISGGVQTTPPTA